MGLTTRIARSVANYQNPHSLGSKFRKSRMALLIDLIKKSYDRYGSVNIIDIGGTITYWQILPKQMLKDYHVTITIVNLPGSGLPDCQPPFKCVEGDGCDLSCYGDNSFHIAHSNSVIEHVGSWERMVKFACEISRLAPNTFIQTPYFWFPIEPHFMTPFYHWLPRTLRIRLNLSFELGGHSRANSLDKAMCTLDSKHLLDQKKFQALFPDSEIIKERFVFLIKSLVAIRDAF